MINIIDNKQANTRTTTLNDIPVGQVFRGDIFGIRSQRYFSGIFYKAFGPATFNQGEYNQFPVDVIVVQLDKQSPGLDSKYANFFGKCSTVTNYEPLDVDLVIKGVSK